MFYFAEQVKIWQRDRPAFGDLLLRTPVSASKTGLESSDRKNFWSATRSRPMSEPGGSEAQSAKCQVDRPQYETGTCGPWRAGPGTRWGI